MNKKKLIIYGNGHMAKMIYQFVKYDFDVVAFTVDRSCIGVENVEIKNIASLPLIPFDEIEQAFSPKQYYMLTAVGFVGMNNIREQKYLEAKAMGYRFVNYIHSSVIQHSCLTLGENNIILDHASIHPYTVIGNCNFISSNSNIGHGCSIGDNNWINAGVAVAGETRIKSHVFLGVNSSLGHGLLIESKTFVGANTQINRNTEFGNVFLSASGEKHRMASESFLRFSSAMKASPIKQKDD
ncbi:LbetaH domain-containing protein [Alkalimarinus alittae]|uniref:Uncharacterized protein n=1 Tax=Alkalimarinus alittae TaxID=2961619 RepID=A0ABY6N606_9ALTE|nr:hypothetical protein [Alkalimarinus alittae]UZE97558.1 hypothetical protein NKI27_07395 [Alkalimarinus alittae]